MNKETAIKVLGGSHTAAAREIGCSVAAVGKWPEVLPPRIADRVLAAYVRRHLPGIVQAVFTPPGHQESRHAA